MSQLYFEIKISEPWFSLVRNGTKTVEGRKNKIPWSQLKIGQIVKIFSAEDPDEMFYAEITGLTGYFPGVVDNLDPLDRFLLGEGLQQTLPGITCLTEARRIYLGFSAIEEILENGMLAIHLTVQ